VDRDDRSVVATFYSPAESAVGERVSLEAAAAHHARVRRLEVGDLVRLTTGAGQLAFGSIAAITKQEVAIVVGRVSRVAPLPALHLLIPVADRDRTLLLAEKSAELGVTSWQPVYFARSRSVTPRGEGEAFTAKVRARMVAALEQSGGAWLPEIRPPAELDQVARSVTGTRVVLEACGLPLTSAELSGIVSLLVGPEGGIEPPELESLRGAGWQVARLAGNTLRFETAAVVGAGMLRSMLTG
jgi:16S rRNA (uracil1498-N3)-methyltransferase